MFTFSDCSFVKSAHDPLSSSQTAQLTSIVRSLISRYPTLTGDSKQVRELLQVRSPTQISLCFFVW